MELKKFTTVWIEVFNETFDEYSFKSNFGVFSIIIYASFTISSNTLDDIVIHNHLLNFVLTN